MSEVNNDFQEAQQPPYQAGPQPPLQNANEAPQPQAVRPNNNLVLAIVSAVLSLCTCCGYASCIGLILGIIAIVFSSQVDSKFNVGDVDGAYKAASNSKLLSYIALATVVVSIILIIVSMLTTDTAAQLEQIQKIIEQYQ